jgi:hypothetical protein
VNVPDPLKPLPPLFWETVPVTEPTQFTPSTLLPLAELLVSVPRPKMPILALELAWHRVTIESPETPATIPWKPLPTALTPSIRMPDAFKRIPSPPSPRMVRWIR